jgi:hypothetical protein
MKKAAPFKANLFHQRNTLSLRYHPVMCQVYHLKVKVPSGVTSETHVESYPSGVRYFTSGRRFSSFSDFITVILLYKGTVLRETCLVLLLWTLFCARSSVCGTNPRRRWEDNIKMDLREIGLGDVDWVHWAQDRDRWRALVNTVMNLRVP